MAQPTRKNNISHKSTLSSFAFTYKINVALEEILTIDKSKYIPVFKAIESRGGTVNHYVYETDKRGLLHIHGVAELPKKVRYSSLVIKGYSSKWKEVYNLAGWLDYMRKDQSLKEAIAYELRSEPEPDNESIESEHLKPPIKSLFHA